MNSTSYAWIWILLGRCKLLHGFSHLMQAYHTDVVFSFSIQSLASERNL